MSNCCAGVLDAQFDSRTVEAQAAHYRRNGATGETRLLVRSLIDTGVAGADVLDIGGGIGIVQLELIAAGASHARSVEASAASIAVARTLAHERGVADRIAHTRGDFLDVADGIEDADVVTLDKVICCYPEMEALVVRSAGCARRTWSAVYPRDTRLIRVVNRIQNVFRRMFRSHFRTFVHPTAAIEALLRSRGFELRSETGTMIWRVVVFERRTTTM